MYLYVYKYLYINIYVLYIYTYVLYIKFTNLIFLKTLWYRYRGSIPRIT